MSASARLAAASAVAASLFAFAPSASAADLYEDAYGQGPARYDRYAQPPADYLPVQLLDHVRSAEEANHWLRHAFRPLFRDVSFQR